MADEGEERQERERAEDVAPPRSSRRRWIVGAAALAIAGGGGFAVYRLLRFPPDTTPEGAYMRIAYNLSRGDVSMVFPYLEDRAQHACFTIAEFRKRAYERVFASYPEPERGTLLAQYEKQARASDGSEIWIDLAEAHGFVTRLRKDLSGVARVERDADRATVETARGTRYAFRKRDNGMWGLTTFTASLVEEADRAARDYDVIQRAAADYDRAR